MIPEILKNAGIDYENGVRRFVGRAHLYEKTLCKFIKDTTFEKIRSAHECGDNTLLFAVAHEFKGMCGNIGLISLYTASDDIVQLLRRDNFTQAELDAAYGSLEAEYNKIYKAVSAATED